MSDGRVGIAIARRTPARLPACARVGGVLELRRRVAGGMGVVVLLGACASGDSDSVSGDTAASSADVAVDQDRGTEVYCDEIREMMSVLGRGGSVPEYDAALSRVADAAPADHREAWRLLLTVSQEPFDYENFNPAVDALDEIFPDLDATCTGLGRMIVDDDGRITELQPD